MHNWIICLIVSLGILLVISSAKNNKSSSKNNNKESNIENEQDSKTVRTNSTGHDENKSESTYDVNDNLVKKC